MSERRVKAWAVVDANGELMYSAGICETKDEAETVYIPYEGERVVPVEIVYKDPGK